MKAWQITAPNTMEETTRQDNLESVSSSKIKITKALITESDLISYSEKNSVYPIIPGRTAIGLVTETGKNCFGIEKNMRVYINPILTCNECFNCRSGNKNKCSDIKIAGENIDGFFRDFAVVDCSDLFPLPSSVTDNEALFIEYIALAISVVDKLHISKGQHISIIGAGTLGNLLSQLIIYYQGVPILIDKDQTKLDEAQNSGIYYTLKNDSSLLKNVSDLTGGRMTEKSVYLTDSGLNNKLPLSLTSFGGKIAFAGFNANNLKIDISVAMKKQLTVYGVTDGYGQTAAAINILVNKALTFSAFKFPTVTFGSIQKTMDEKTELLKNNHKFNETIIKLL